MVKMTFSREENRKIKKTVLTKKIECHDKQLILMQERTQETPLAEGDFIAYRFHDNITVHGGTSSELADSNMVSAVPPSFIVTVLLQGQLRFSYDDLEFHLDSKTKPCAVVVNLAKPANFRREFRAGNQVSKLNLCFHPSWITQRAGLDCPVQQFSRYHKAHQHIELDQEMLELTHALMALSHPQTFQEKMRFEILTHTLAARVLNQLTQGSFQVETDIITPRYSQVTHIVNYIEKNLDQNLSLEHLAAQFSMSVSNLQRRFKQNLNLTVSGYIRLRRLEIAKQQLERGQITITEAAYEAGYQHPSNFTSAFKRAFGVPPQQIYATK
ncbi:helix-turn-helix domain-containing protein [Photobacterium sp. TY1-4]|uniref:helix-turn-helix domain-containing protein n=1 Tax=Photobacterium sp. TY1-4 TaxID=2899122 RepID=UPI0021C078B0|nr:AraC family transcriptional regulator [Photobacterium sp. TY1-4]UXI02426.1 AraC family transcriptional regulator [Photobacterium sp. TY1-4]